MAGEKPSAKTLSCPNCNGTIQIRGLGQTCTIACSHCGSIFDIQDDKFKLIEAFDKLQFRPLIPLGTRGKFGDTVFEMIGAMVRTDKSGDYSWTEYLLFNPYQGFRWLVVNQGHWSFVTPIKGNPATEFSSANSPAGSTECVKYEGEYFKLFLSGQAVVKNVVGEFYWQVRSFDTVEVADYISPPYMLSMEKSEGETVWSVGEYVPVSKILKIFPQIQDPPPKFGIAPNQPSPYASARGVGVIGFITVCLMFLVQFMFNARATNQLVLNASHTIGDVDAQKTWNTSTFTTKKQATLTVNANSPVDNSWVYLELDLVDAKSGESIDSAVEIAYYHGVDSDGSWSEGSTYGSASFSEVPQGDYYLTVTGSMGDVQRPDQYYAFDVRSDIPYWGNFLAAFLGVVIFPAVIGIASLVHENKRWEDADPYGQYS